MLSTIRFRLTECFFPLQEDVLFSHILIRQVQLRLAIILGRIIFFHSGKASKAKSIDHPSTKLPCVLNNHNLFLSPKSSAQGRAGQTRSNLTIFLLLHLDFAEATTDRHMLCRAILMSDICNYEFLKIQTQYLIYCLGEFAEVVERYMKKILMIFSYWTF